MAELPKISIVTPSLNQGKFIAKTINSVLTQAYPALEYIVVDGGSTDETLSILRSYHGKLTWSSEVDGGQSAAINKGWQNSSGDIVAWLNSDDQLRPRALQEVSRLFKESPETVMLYGECDYLDAFDNVIGRYPTAHWDYSVFLKNTTNFLPQPSVFMRREALARAGGLDESLHYLMDYDLFLRLGLEGKVTQSSATLSALRLHTSAKSLKALSGFGAEMVRVTEAIFASSKLPAEISRYREETIRNALLYAASTCFWGGEIKESRVWLSKCWKQAAWPKIPSSLIRLSLLASLGKPGLQWAERFGKNPYKRMLLP